jgi:hypothetical protein
MRMNESMQIRLDADCFVCLEMPAPPGAEDKTPRLRWLFRLITKGERESKPADYHIGSDTRKVLVTLCRLLQEHYRFQPGEPCWKFHSRRITPGRIGLGRVGTYSSTADRRFPPTESPGACDSWCKECSSARVRGRSYCSKAHLLRHAFATHSVQVEKYPLDVVGGWLKQKNLTVTTTTANPRPA